MRQVSRVVVEPAGRGLFADLQAGRTELATARVDTAARHDALARGLAGSPNLTQFDGYHFSPHFVSASLDVALANFCQMLQEPAQLTS